MGLDVYFIKEKKSDWNKVNFGGSKKTVSGDGYESKGENIAHFRKVNFLVKFFNYTENCSYRLVTRSEIESLRKNCLKLARFEPCKVQFSIFNNFRSAPEMTYSKDAKKIASETLPTMEGFFFGSTDYDEHYFEQIKEVLVFTDYALENVANDEVVLMLCSW